MHHHPADPAHQIIVVNFAHPVTATHRARIAEMSTHRADAPLAVIDVPVQLDLQAPLPSQISAPVDGVGLSSTERLIVNLPGICTCICNTVGRTARAQGYFPAILQLREQVRTHR